MTRCWCGQAHEGDEIDAVERGRAALREHLRLSAQAIAEKIDAEIMAEFLKRPVVPNRLITLDDHGTAHIKPASPLLLVGQNDAVPICSEHIPDTSRPTTLDLERAEAVRTWWREGVVTPSTVLGPDGVMLSLPSDQNAGKTGTPRDSNATPEG